MAGVLDFLNERKAYFQESRQNKSEEYVEKLGESTAKLARQVGMGAESNQRLTKTLGSQRAEVSANWRMGQVEDRKQHFATLSQGERQITQVRTLGYDLGNDIKSLGANLSHWLKEIAQNTKDIKRGLNQGGSVLDLLDRRGRRGRGRRGRRGRPVGTRGPTTAGKPGLFKRAGESLKSGAASIRSRAAGWFRNGAAVESARTAGPSLRSAGRMGTALRSGGKLLGPAALALTAYDVVNTVRDPSKTGAQKATGVAQIAGGTAGALAMGAGGAKLGAALGTAIAPGLGTAVGGVLGGLGGGALGYFGGEKIVGKLTAGLSSAVEKSGIGTAMGRSAALVMSPFSAEARQAIKNDWNNSILPAWQSTITPLKSIADSWGEKLTEFGSTFWEDGKETAKNIGMAAAAPVRVAMGAVRNVAHRVEQSGETGRRVVQTARQARDAVTSVLPAGVSQALGFISAKYESGGRGVHTISSGKGDHGGASYGKHQLASANGSMSKFLASEEGKKYATQFAGLRPGSKEFNDKYRQIVSQDASGMESAQQQYIVRTHYDPLARKVARDTGFDVNKRGRAVQEAIMSTSVQYGGGTSIVTEALRGRDPSKMTDEEIVNAIQDRKAATVDTRFRSSSAQMRAGVAKRIERERADLLALNKQQATTGANPDTGVAVLDTHTGKVTTSERASPSSVTPSTSQATPKTSTAQNVVATASAPTVSSPISSRTANVTGARFDTPVQPVRPNTPVETRPVAVVSQPDQKAPAVQQVAASESGTRRSPSLSIGIDDVPAFVPDPSMLAPLFGRV